MTVVRPPPPRVAGGGQAAAGWPGSAAHAWRLTIAAGGFVAGTHAGFDYNSFPADGWTAGAGGLCALQPFAAQSDREHRCGAVRPSAAGDTDCGRRALPPCSLGWPPPLPRARASCAAGLPRYRADAIPPRAWRHSLLVVPAALATVHQAIAALLRAAASLAPACTRSRPSGSGHARGTRSGFDCVERCARARPRTMRAAGRNSCTRFWMPFRMASASMAGSSGHDVQPRLHANHDRCAAECRRSPREVIGVGPQAGEYGSGDPDEIFAQQMAFDVIAPAGRASGGDRTA